LVVVQLHPLADPGDRWVGGHEQKVAVVINTRPANAHSRR
jgi:hypothetical protein